MAPRLIAEAFKVNKCPLYPVGGAMVFREPAVGGIDPHPACALAVEKFLPTLRKIWKGKPPEKFSGLSCGGCQGGEAWFRFRLEDVKTEAVGEDISEQASVILKQSRIFAGMDPNTIRQAIPLFTEFSISAGDVLIEKAGPVDGLYVVVEGKFDVIQPDEEGLTAIVAEVGPGECLGEISMITGDRASATVLAQTDAKLVMVDRARVPNLMMVVPALPARLAHILASRLIQTGQRLQQEVKRGLKGRLDAISPAELVQTLVVSNLSGVLRIEHGGREGQMFFHQGKLGKVKLDDKAGEEAFYEFLSWMRGSFNFEPGKEEEDTTEERRDPTPLLLEGMRRQDESLRTERTGVRPPPASV